MNEITIISKVGSLTYNFDKLKQDVESNLKKYKNLIITEEDIPDSKRIRAELNSNKKELNDRKIEIKKEFMLPYTEFENQVKNVIKSIDEVSNDIDEQIKAFEKLEKDKKLERIKDYTHEIGLDIIDFNLLYIPQWLNKNINDTQWKSDLNEKLNAINMDLEVLDLEGEEIKALYLKSLNLDQAYKELEYNQEKRRLIAERENKSVEVPKPKAAYISPEKEYNKVKHYIITTTDEKFKNFNEYLKINKIEYTIGE